MSRFPHYPSLPAADAVRSAFTILCSAHDAASSFLDIFEATRGTRKAKGAPTDEEQDLLRAMLVFAGAGLDSMIKQLVRDALSLTIDRSKGAEEKFKGFISRRLAPRDTLDPGFLSSVLVSRDPREELVSTLVADLVSQSLQSKDQVFRVASNFDIPSTALATDPKLLDRIFRARNEIVHEMDVDFDQTNRNRRPRRKAMMIDYTTEIPRLANAFLIEVDRGLDQAAVGSTTRTS